MLHCKVIMEIAPNPNQELTKNIAELSTTTKRINSLKFVFFRGIVSGVGTFIGATVVAAILITVIVQILGLFDIEFGIKEYLSSLLIK